MKEFFEDEKIEEPADPKLREVRMYLNEFQRQHTMDFVKYYTPFFAALIASALISKSCSSNKQHQPDHDQTPTSSQHTSK